MMMHKFVSVMCVVPFLSSFSEYRSYEVINASKGDIVKCVKGGNCTTIGDLKKIIAGTGCSGCMLLVSCSLTEFSLPELVLLEHSR